MSGITGWVSGKAAVSVIAGFFLELLRFLEVTIDPSAGNLFVLVLLFGVGITRTPEVVPSVGLAIFERAVTSVGVEVPGGDTSSSENGAGASGTAALATGIAVIGGIDSGSEVEAGCST